MALTVYGDLLTSKADFILHQVNCQGKMGSGIALQVKRKWPVVHDEYMNLYSDIVNRQMLLGHAQFVPISDEQTVVNIFGQFNYGYDKKRYTNYEAIYRGFETVAKYAKGQTVALPYNMGCDRGGANWNIVYAMILQIFKDCNVTIYKWRKEI